MSLARAARVQPHQDSGIETDKVDFLMQCSCAWQLFARKSSVFY